MMKRNMRRSAGMVAALAALAGAAVTTAPQFSPLVSGNATRGLPNTYSAAALGDGRVSFLLSGATFKQDQDLGEGSVNKNAYVSTFQGAFAYGLNGGVDVFGALHMYSADENNKGIGSGNIGLKFSLPFDEKFPLRIGAMGQVIAGLSDTQLICDYRNDGSILRPDGYNYQETRDHYDFQAMLLQSILLGDDIKFALHANEGMQNSVSGSAPRLLLLSGGFELAPWPYAAIAMEASWRTEWKHIDAKDPFWISPSLHVTTPAGFNLFAGTDIRMSKARENDARALSQVRAFGGISASFDVFAKQRAAARAKAEADSLELLRLRGESSSLAADKDRLLGKGRMDSAQLADMQYRLEMLKDSLDRREKDLEVRERELAAKDSALLAANQQTDLMKLKADSLEKKRIQDSIDMANKYAAMRGSFERDLINKGVAKLEAIHFENGKAELHPDSKAYLKIVGDILTRYPKLKIEIGGHTDNKGKAASNLKLSGARAASTCEFLVNTFPDLSNMLSTKGYGSSKPKASNKTAAGRAANRRIEMKVLNPEVLKEYQH